MMSKQPASRQPRKGATIRSRGEWRTLIVLALRCVEDVERDATGEVAFQRRAALANRLNAASASVFDREFGAATHDVATSFIRTAGAFARSGTPEGYRAELAALVRHGAQFLDQRLADRASEEFQRAHAGRPEVWG